MALSQTLANGGFAQVSLSGEALHIEGYGANDQIETRPQTTCRLHDAVA